MSSDRTPFHSHLPAPCIVDSGTVVNKQDMRRLLCDLGPVRYRYTQGEHCISEGEGYVVEVFSDPSEATLVTNHSLYLNICSFDYLELSQVLAPDDGAQSLVEHPTALLTSSSNVTLHPTPKHGLDQDKSLSLKNVDVSSKEASPKEASLKEASLKEASPKEASPKETFPQKEACFKLVQDHTVLQLIPLSNPLKSRQNRTTSLSLDAVVADMLSTNLDINDDDDCFPF